MRNNKSFQLVSRRTPGASWLIVVSMSWQANEILPDRNISQLITDRPALPCSCTTEQIQWLQHDAEIINDEVKIIHTFFMRPIVLEQAGVGKVIVSLVTTVGFKGLDRPRSRTFVFQRWAASDWDRMRTLMWFVDINSKASAAYPIISVLQLVYLCNKSVKLLPVLWSACGCPHPSGTRCPFLEGDLHKAAEVKGMRLKLFLFLLPMWLHSGEAVSALASQREGPGSDRGWVHWWM